MTWGCMENSRDIEGGLVTRTGWKDMKRIEKDWKAMKRIENAFFFSHFRLAWGTFPATDRSQNASEVLPKEMCQGWRKFWVARVTWFTCFGSIHCLFLPACFQDLAWKLSESTGPCGNISSGRLMLTPFVANHWPKPVLRFVPYFPYLSVGQLHVPSPPQNVGLGCLDSLGIFRDV